MYYLILPLVFYSFPAQAYINPTTIGFFFQMMVLLATTGLAIVFAYWQVIKSMFRRRKASAKEAESTTPDVKE
jgi:hypothetical protein